MQYIFNFYNGHDIEEIKANRYLYFQYNNQLKESERDSYLLLKKKDNLDICKTANKLYNKIFDYKIKNKNLN